MTRQGAELFLAVLSLLGPQYEGFFNGVAPGGPQRLHSQYWLKQTTIFDTIESPQRWPVPFDFITGTTLAETAVWMVDQVPRFSHVGKRCDFMYRFDGTRFTSICIPRGLDRLKPVYTLADGKASKYNRSFGGFGVLEMAGCLMAIKSKAALERLGVAPYLYEQALCELIT